MSGRRFLHLHHHTFLTGDMRPDSPRAEVGADLIGALRPVVHAGGGTIPGLPGWFIHLSPMPDATGRGHATASVFFQFAPEPGWCKWPAVMSWLCWDGAESAVTWELAARSHDRMWAPLGGRPAASHPPPTPWLAAQLSPIAMTQCDGPLLMLFGDLERCLAWTIIEEAGL